MVFGIIVIVSADFQTGTGKDTVVVRPGRVAYPDTFCAGLFSNEISRDTQRTSAARRLCGTGAFGGDDVTVITKQQCLSYCSEFRDPGNRQVVFRGFIIQQILFRFFNAAQYRCFTGFIFINTNT